jgi:hypothetical protein
MVSLGFKASDRLRRRWGEKVAHSSQEKDKHTHTTIHSTLLWNFYPRH